MHLIHQLPRKSESIAMCQILQPYTGMEKSCPPLLQNTRVLIGFLCSSLGMTISNCLQYLLFQSLVVMPNLAQFDWWFCNPSTLCISQQPVSLSNKHIKNICIGLYAGPMQGRWLCHMHILDLDALTSVLHQLRSTLLEVSSNWRASCWNCLGKERYTNATNTLASSFLLCMSNGGSTAPMQLLLQFATSNFWRTWRHAEKLTKKLHMQIWRHLETISGT